MARMRRNRTAAWHVTVGLFVAVAATWVAPTAVSAHHPPFHEPPMVDAIETNQAFCVELLENHPYPDKVARWCPLVNHYFGDGWTHWALHIIACESNGDPDAANKRSSARGLFQHLTSRYWAPRAVKAGWPGASVFDPEANVAVSAWLFNDGKGRSHWTCKAHR